MTICNACRYCEGYCAVWDAIEFRSFLDKKEMPYFANLCYDCKDCYYACPFNEPFHEFALNIPKVLSEARLQSYKDSVWPSFMRFSYSKPWIFSVGVTIFALVIVLAYPVLLLHQSLIGYMPLTSLIPEIEFRYITLGIYLYTIILWTINGIRFSKIAKNLGKINFHSVSSAIFDVFTHKYFWGGGVGCKYPNYNSKYIRGIFHLFLFYGFILALGSIQFYPNLIISIVVLYTLASIFYTIGALGMLIFDLIDTKETRSKSMTSLDLPFTILLFLTGITGIIFPLISDTPIYGFLFLVHDAFILAIFLIAPYSKFIHPVYRGISMLKFHAEKLFQMNQTNQN